MKNIILFSLFFLYFNLSLSQSDTNALSFSYSSKSNLYTPAKANLFESRTGLIKDFNSSNIRLDIAYSPDIFTLLFSKNQFSIGPDFHAFGLLFNQNDKIILQVAAIDAIFGGHIVWKKNIPNNHFSFRFRILHLSSHLVDGLYQDDKWKDNKKPSPFGREFFDFFLYYHYNDLKISVGTDFIFRQRPDALSKFNPEISLDKNIFSFPTKEISIYFSINFKYQGLTSKSILNKTIELGTSFGFNNPLDIFVLYYSGSSFYGEYYSNLLNFVGIGFSFR